MAKTYGQFCALARALDHVGDRWTLLIVRELLLGPASYGELCASLEGVPTNLLADRLKTLTEDGIVDREPAMDDRRRVTYRLTSLGEALGPSIDALIVWGAHWMASGPGEDRFDPRWAALALRALLADRASSFGGVIQFTFGPESVQIVGSGHSGLAGADRPTHVSIDGPAPLLLALASGQLSSADAGRAGVQIRGPRRAVQALFA